MEEEVPALELDNQRVGAAARALHPVIILHIFNLEVFHPQPSHSADLFSRDQLIWQIEEYLYPTSILGMIYHIRADAFIFFGL